MREGGPSGGYLAQVQEEYYWKRGLGVGGWGGGWNGYGGALTSQSREQADKQPKKKEKEKPGKVPKKGLSGSFRVFQGPVRRKGPHGFWEGSFYT